jgi:hypothetical protein
MNQERIDLLDRIERESLGKLMSCEKILFAMLIPALRLARDERRGGKNFLRLLGAPTRPRSIHPPLPLGAVPEMIGRYKEASTRRCRTCRGRSSRGACTS